MRYGLDPNIFLRQIRQESNFDPNAVSPAGAIGIAQIMPGTAQSWGVDPHDPAAALNAAAKNMAGYVRKYGGYRNALIAYNAGPGRVGGSLPAETQHYIDVILNGRDPGKLGQPAGGGGSAGGSQPPVGVAPVQALTGSDPGQGADVSALLAQLSQSGFQKPSASAASLPAPAAIAGPQMPAAYKALTTSGGPQPKQRDISGLLSMIQTQGQGVGPGGAVAGAGGPTAPSAAPSGGSAGLGAPGAQTGSGQIQEFVARANQLDARHLPYEWGGGHEGKVNLGKVNGLDCSGAVSAVLGINPRVASQFETWGKSGDGGKSGLTIYAKDSHVLMKINGHFWGTSRTNPGGGAGWIPQGAISRDYLKGFQARHL